MNAWIYRIQVVLETLGGIFKIPKDRPSQTQVKDIVYKFKCKTCNFLYIGESKISWKSRWAEHKPGTRPQIESAIKEHAERTGHEVCSGDVEILERGVHNYDKLSVYFSSHYTQQKKQWQLMSVKFPANLLAFVAYLVNLHMLSTYKLVRST